MAAFAHNVLKLTFRLAKGVGPPSPASSALAAALSSETTVLYAVARCSHQGFHFFLFKSCGSTVAPAFR